ncbi:MAG: hypothetical protein AUJ92_12045 [Armatimonadetes bacterium CG2_30_59_28]|nr:MAG: hypothetical protein AUJ92_12045 [Armatimonadetes bacterium CG2_30_59_28]
MPEKIDLSAIQTEFGAGNYVVLATYFLAMLIIGIRAGRQTRGAAGYFTGEGKIHHVLVGLSLLGTYLSALTMMALPAMSFGKADMTWSIQIPFLLITAVVITRFVLPRYREAGCLSVYEFLEQQIHVSSRLLASVAFIALSIGRMGLVLYLPALSFSIVTGFDLMTTLVVMGIIVTFYTVLGGIRGVIWTDAIQVVIFIVGALVSLVYMFDADVNFLAIANAHHKFRVFNWDTRITEVTTLWLVLETVFQTIRIYATQQDMTQRYIAAESTEKANRSVWISILGYIPLGYLFYFIGVALFVYYTANPDPNVELLARAEKLDSLYGYFVVTHMPQGLAGLVIAAFFAASMSTISSSMNSCSAVCVEDFYRRFSRSEKPDDHYLRVAKSLSLVWGLLTVVMGILLMEITRAQVVWSKTMSISTCGMLGLMALAFLPRRIHPAAAVTGFVSSYVALFVMMYCLRLNPTVGFVFPIEKGTGVNFLLWPVVGNLVCFFVALGVDTLLPNRGAEPE